MIYVKIFYPNISFLKNYNEHDILKAVSEVSGVHQALILGKIQQRHITDPRAVTGTLLNELLQWDYYRICRFINWKHWASVVHAKKNVNNIPELVILKQKVINKLNVK